MFILLACVVSLICVSSYVKPTNKTERVIKAISLGCFTLGILIETGAFK